MYRSNAQRKYFHVALERGDISAKTVKEYDKASKGKKLPEYAGNKSSYHIKETPKVKLPRLKKYT